MLKLRLAVCERQDELLLKYTILMSDFMLERMTESKYVFQQGVDGAVGCNIFQLQPF